MLPKTVALIAVGSLFFSSGCTLMEMNRDSEMRERRIPVKRQQLYGEGEQHEALAAERQQLEARRSLIRGKEDELNRTLESSSRQISQMETATRQQKKRRRELETRIRRIEAEKEALGAQADTDAKRQKLEALQKEADQLFGLPLGKGSPK